MNIQEIFQNENNLDHDLKLYTGQKKDLFLRHPSSVPLWIQALFTNHGNNGMTLPSVLQSFDSPVHTNRNIFCSSLLSTMLAHFLYMIHYQRHPDSC